MIADTLTEFHGLRNRITGPADIGLQEEGLTLAEGVIVAVIGRRRAIDEESSEFGFDGEGERVKGGRRERALPLGRAGVIGTRRVGGLTVGALPSRFGRGW